MGTRSPSRSTEQYQRPGVRGCTRTALTLEGAGQPLRLNECPGGDSTTHLRGWARHTHEHPQQTGHPVRPGRVTRRAVAQCPSHARKTNPTSCSRHTDWGRGKGSDTAPLSKQTPRRTVARPRPPRPVCSVNGVLGQAPQQNRVSRGPREAGGGAPPGPPQTKAAALNCSLFLL